MDTHVVIMAGGIGSRFWPLSTPDHPKQFIDVLGCGRSLIQMTFDRLAEVCQPENFWVVTNAAYVEIVKEQLPLISESHILAEPAARNTAPCIAWACWRISAENPDANILVTPSDAVVMNQAEFQRVVKNALVFTKDNEAIVTIGIRPTRPETGYGYIEAIECSGSEICNVKAFKEKPNIAIAQSYYDSGKYFWNAGIFVWRASTIIGALIKYKPNIAKSIDAMLVSGDVESIFPTCEKISIDYAVMEPAAADGIVFTHPADFGWSDLGNWASLHEKLEKDSNGNASVGNVHFFDCKDCIAHVEDARQVSIQGLDGYIISEKNGQLLICKRRDEQRISEFGKTE